MNTNYLLLNFKIATIKKWRENFFRGVNYTTTTQLEIILQTKYFFFSSSGLSDSRQRLADSFCCSESWLTRSISTRQTLKRNSKNDSIQEETLIRCNVVKFCPSWLKLTYTNNKRNGKTYEKYYSFVLSFRSKNLFCFENIIWCRSLWIIELFFILKWILI